ncbi:hypothetical protein GDO81_014580 [Engystomops pustulosus]|uniref:Peptidase S1 domain-containing protein n=1 Tax=Engystomops pustulosus TaxID=76066 RepID=A0AAV7BBD2_ENGPU|nr:hypothetical protein GDO81_014580 [Engystomops pustulosus]
MNCIIAGEGQRSMSRIIGGYSVSPYSTRYLVSLKRNTGLHFCGGSLISRFWVLTAAHCKTEQNQMLIVAGEYSLSIFEGTEQIFRPVKLVSHPDYSSSSKNADIMLIKVSRANVTPITPRDPHICILLSLKFKFTWVILE